MFLRVFVIFSGLLFVESLVRNVVLAGVGGRCEQALLVGEKTQLFDGSSLLMRAPFSGEKLSYAIELKYGGLKQVGSYLTQLKYLYVERFSVVTEFAQNASSRFATSNFKGWDLRIRHKLTKKLWVGGRLSRTQRLVGSPEQSVRFRLETKYMFNPFKTKDMAEKIILVLKNKKNSRQVLKVSNLINKIFENEL